MDALVSKRSWVNERQRQSTGVAETSRGKQKWRTEKCMLLYVNNADRGGEMVHIGGEWDENCLKMEWRGSHDQIVCVQVVRVSPMHT